MGGCRGARLLLQQSRTLFSPASSSLAKQSHQYQHQLQHPRAYVRTRLLFSKFKDSASHFVPPSTPSTSSSCATANAGAASYATGKGFVNWYLSMIEARPVLTKSLTAGFIFTAADLSSQIITLKSIDSLDLIRTCRMAGYGMLISGPSLHLWFNFLSKNWPKRDIITTFKKMIIGQTTYGPFITAVFFSQNAALQGESASEILARLKRDLLPTLINGLVYWPMCDFITFKFVPVRLQPLVSNSFSFLWTIYLTYMASLEKAGKPKISED